VRFYGTVVQYVPQQRPKRYQRRQVGMGICRQMDLAHADRSNIHVGISNQALRVRSGKIALENHATRPFDRSMNRDPKTRPRMKWVK
jgi:hypothetical protein